MPRGRAGLAWLCALVVLASAAPAAASTVALLPRTGGSGVGPGPRDEAVEALRTVLINEEWTIHDLDPVSTALPPRLSACGPDDRCSFELREMVGVDVVIGLRLWGTEDAVERLAVVVVGERGVGHFALAEVTDEQPVELAVAEAARHALVQWQQGVVTDAALTGVPGDLADRYEPGRVAASPANWFAGALLLLGSAPLLGYGINTAVHDGECVTEGPVPGTCSERIRFKEGAGILTGLGGTLLLAGVFTWILQPIRVTVHASMESASFTLSGRF